MRHPMLIGALLVALAVPSTAAAWTPIAGGSPVWNPPVPYFLNNAGSSDLGGFRGTEPEVVRGMDDWTRVSCTILTTNYGGGTSRQAGSYEGVSTIGWIEAGWRHGSGAIGVTGPRWGRNIVEADMELNGVNYTWITGPGRGGRVNAYSILLHEGGHFYGLGHSEDRSAAMYFAYQGGTDSLGPDDENGICALYPGSGTDCTTTGCPSGQECVAGRCQVMRGDGTICSPCTADSQCGGAGDFCLGYPDGGQFCGRACASDADCGGDRCLSTSGGVRQCGRVVGAEVTCTASPSGDCRNDADCSTDQRCAGGSCVPVGAGAGLGEACGSGDDCASGLCLGGVCTSTCNWTNPTSSCPGGFYCDADDSTCDTGYCMRGSGGAGEAGDSCVADTDCSTALCASGRCSEPCVPDGTPGCPSGFACQLGTLSCRGSCQRSGTLGDPCEDNAGCTSGICAVMEERSFCTDFCAPETPCPENFTCTPVGDASICVPDTGGLGQPCAGNQECVSGLCASEGGEDYCTRLCDASEPCPSGYDCLPTATEGVGACALVDPTSTMNAGCGCRVGGVERGGGSFSWLVLGLLLLWDWRRRA